MVRGVEAGTFEYDSHRGDHFLERSLAAFGTGLERGVVEGLVALELHTARLTTIHVNGHVLFSLPFQFQCNRAAL